MSTPSLKVVVAITSPIAFHQLNSHSVLHTSIQRAQEYVDQCGAPASLAIAGSLQDLQLVQGFEFEKIVCDPNSPSSFAKALKESQPFELLMIHDCMRPLTQIAQFDRVFQALTPVIDGVRATSPFTETLKVVSSENFIIKTIDRSSMMRVSTPELLRSSAIDFDGVDSTWFVPLTDRAKLAQVDAEPESNRINSEKEIELMRALLSGQQ